MYYFVIINCPMTPIRPQKDKLNQTEISIRKKIFIYFLILLYMCSLVKDMHLAIQNQWIIALKVIKEFKPFKKKSKSLTLMFPFTLVVVIVIT